MSENLGFLEAFLGLNLNGFNAGLATAQKSMVTAGKSMKRAGATMTRNISMPLAAVGGIAIKMSMDFEKSMSKIEGLVGIAADKVAGFKQDVLGLAGETAQSPQKLAEAMFFITSAGLRGADALDVLSMSAKGAGANMGDVAVIADLVTSATNAYGIEALSAAQAMDTLTATIREGKRPPEEIAQSIGRVLPVASEMGVSFQTVGAAIAAMSRTGTDAAEAVTGLRQILFSVLNPAQQSEEAFKKMGTSGYELKEMLGSKNGLLKLLEFLRKNTSKSSNAFSDAFPNIRALAGALDLMGKNADENSRIFKTMADNTGDLDKAFGAASKTASFQLNQAMADLKVEMIKIGDILMPIFRDLVAGLRGLITGFSRMSSGTKKAILVLGGLAITLGPLLTIFGTMATIIGSITWPILAVIAAVAALGAALVYISDNWKAIVERLSDWAWWKNMLISMIQFLVEWNPFSVMMDGINKLKVALGGDPLPNPFEFMSEVLENLKVETKEYEHEFGTFGDAVANAANKAKNALTGLFNAGAGGGGGAPVAGPAMGPTDAAGAMGLGEFQKKGNVTGTEAIEQMSRSLEGLSLRLSSVNAGLAAMAERGQGFADIVGGVLSSAFDGLGNAIISGMEQGQSALESFKQFFIQFAKGLIAKMISMIVTALILSAALSALGFGVASGGAITKGVGFAKSMGNMLKGGLQGLAGGGYVNQGGLFNVHKKETVALPAGSAVTPANMRGGGSNQTITVKGELSGGVIKWMLDEEERKIGNTR